MKQKPPRDSRFFRRWQTWQEVVPTDLASVERMILHYSHRSARATAPTDLASVERMILHYSGSATHFNAPTDLVSVERVIEP